MNKYIVCEGKSDKLKLMRVLDEPVEFVCTNGTIGAGDLEDLMEALENEEVFVVVDEDYSGEKIRRQIRNELPNAKHLHTLKEYREIATTPEDYLVKILQEADFKTVKTND